MARRGLLAGLGGVGLTLGLAACGQSAEAPAPTTTAHPVGSAKLELILLGTRAGPPPAADQAGISTALVVDGHTYLIDCGRGSVSQFAKAGLKFASIRSIFLTHLHIDHLADYYNYFVLGAANFAEPLGASGLVSVYGPGPAGGLPPKPGGGTAPTVATADPTPGTKAMTDNLNAAFAYSSNALMLAGGANPTAPIDVHEIAIPPIGADFTNRAPVMQPFPVMSDGTVTVSAILVPHGPVFPAFAFRFDTAYGSVTFSGDTTYTDNIPTLAKNTDVLVHEAINMEGTSLSPELRNHSLESHVEVQKVGAIAQRSGARKLVLSHIADSRPGPLDARQWHAWAQQGYDGEVIVGADLQTIVVK
ncbi:MBL fold metallo-hydrolase [Nocardia fluminea]|uniref:MBL fold metallo-hydrolase n=1 Tax=Nocardia fluminea TaxID=134984 RepID=UPI003D0B5FEC